MSTETNTTRKLSREERTAWLSFYRDAFRHILARNGEVVQRSLDRVIELSERAAWNSLDAYRRAVRKVRP